MKFYGIEIYFVGCFFLFSLFLCDFFSSIFLHPLSFTIASSTLYSPPPPPPFSLSPLFHLLSNIFFLCSHTIWLSAFFLFSDNAEICQRTIVGYEKMTMKNTQSTRLLFIFILNCCCCAVYIHKYIWDEIILKVYLATISSFTSLFDYDYLLIAFWLFIFRLLVSIIVNVDK